MPSHYNTERQLGGRAGTFYLENSIAKTNAGQIKTSSEKLSAVGLHFRSITIWPTACLLVLGLVRPGPGFGIPPDVAKVSVLLITLDTVRADRLGCYGYKAIETPNIDALARDGARFANAYAQVPITLPSHTVILTGTYPMYNRVRDFTSSGLPTGISTLAEKFRHSGYQTSAFVSSFAVNSMWGLDRGFELYDDDVGLNAAVDRDPLLAVRRGEQTVDGFIGWLPAAAGKPFFAWLHLYDAHSPYYASETFRKRYAGHPYLAAIAYEDAQVGRVIERLRAMRLYDRTAIAVVSDHGESLGEHGEAEHGFFVYNATLHVPLILKLPSQSNAGRVVSEPVGTVDLAPTLARIGGLPAKESSSFQGRPLLRFVGRSTAVAQDEAVYAESYYPRDSFGWHELRALITSRWKYIDAPRPELYDLPQDARESADLAEVNAVAGAALRARLEAFQAPFESREEAPSKTLDSDVIEKLRSLGYVAYSARGSHRDSAATADPKDKITTYNRILRAGDLSRLGRHAEADNLLANLERDDAALYVVLFERGENYLAWGKPDAAAREFQKALSRNPSFDQGALGLGRAYMGLGQSAQAVTAFELATRLNPRNSLARMALAKTYWQQNQLDEAETQLALVVKSQPSFGEAHADYGIILAKLRKYPAAAKEIERGIKLGFEDAVAYNYLGVAHSQMGDGAGAIRDYERAAALDPRYPVPYLNLALHFRKQGDPAKARGYYQKACGLSQELCRQYASQFPPG
jgi:arylsulfatase A-like enzyme/Flp pilus assembly protein TadD